MQSTPIVSIASIAGAQPTQIIASTPSLAITASQGGQLALASTQPPTQILGTSQITLTPGKFSRIFVSLAYLNCVHFFNRFVSILQLNRWELLTLRNHWQCRRTQLSQLFRIRL